MIHLFPEKITGAVFDVDDTLLDNQAGVERGTIHELTRLRAIHKVAETHNLPRLAALTEQENIDAFLNASVHSVDGAVWEALYLTKVVDAKELDPGNELLNEIVQLKNSLHVDTLRQLGKEVLDASEFVHLFADTYKIQGSMAIASTAIRRDIGIFLDELTDLRKYFPEERIVAFEDIPHGLGKPHPEAFNRAFATLRLPEAERGDVVAFEDDPRGIVAAKKAGMFVCAIATRFTPEQLRERSEPDVVIENFRQLIDAIAAGKGV